MKVMRNPKRHQHKNSKFVLFRVEQETSDGFRTIDAALGYGKKLAPAVRWVQVNVEPRYVVRSLETIRDKWVVVDQVDPKNPRQVTDGYKSKRAADMHARELNDERA